MARQLWLLRHADAEPHGTRPDAERRLTARGEAQAHAAGEALERMRASFDLVLSSPRVRALQTAELAAEHWDASQRELVAVHEPLSAGFAARDALDALAGTPPDARVLLVGHEPDLSNVLAELTGARADVKKGGLAIVRLEGPGGELVALLRPRELALIAEAGVGALSRPVGGD
jgi:phosphohistidine phosphatase